MYASPFDPPVTPVPRKYTPKAVPGASVKSAVTV
jgi:hypothetical protein